MLLPDRGLALDCDVVHDLYLIEAIDIDHAIKFDHFGLSRLNYNGDQTSQALALALLARGSDVSENYLINLYLRNPE